MSEVLLEVNNLKVYFPVKEGLFRRASKFVHAVDDVNFSVRKGETLGLVGESGCGKTTLARAVLMLTRPTAGEVHFKGQNLLQLSKAEMQKIRRKMQIVFQDSLSSLDPRMTVKKIVGEPLVVHHVATGESLRNRISELLQKVGLSRHHLYRFPHEFSGGQRQRIGIARALTLDPELMVLDEPTSSLDVSVQAQILNLLQDLQKELGLSYLFISHDLSTIRYMSHRIAVMYLGKIMEVADKQELFHQQLNPYTQALFSAIPTPDPKNRRKRIILPGDVPSPIDVPLGCRFHPRCPYAKEICTHKAPEFVEFGNRHFARCHLIERAR